MTEARVSFLRQTRKQYSLAQNHQMASGIFRIKSEFLTEACKTYVTWPLIDVSDLISHSSLPRSLCCCSHTSFLLVPCTCPWASDLALPLAGSRFLSQLLQASILRAPSQRGLPETWKYPLRAHTLTHTIPWSYFIFLHTQTKYLFFYFPSRTLAPPDQGLYLFH